MRAKVNIRVKELIYKVWLKISAEDNSYADQRISEKTWLRVIRKRVLVAVLVVVLVTVLVLVILSPRPPPLSSLLSISSSSSTNNIRLLVQLSGCIVVHSASPGRILAGTLLGCIVGRGATPRRIVVIGATPGRTIVRGARLCCILTRLSCYTWRCALAVGVCPAAHRSGFTQYPAPHPAVSSQYDPSPCSAVSSLERNAPRPAVSSVLYTVPSSTKRRTLVGPLAPMLCPPCLLYHRQSSLNQRGRHRR